MKDFMKFYSNIVTNVGLLRWICTLLKIPTLFHVLPVQLVNQYVTWPLRAVLKHIFVILKL